MLLECSSTYLPPTMLKAFLMLRAWTPTLKRAVPLLTSTETFTIFCCSITLAPSVLFLGAGKVSFSETLCVPRPVDFVLDKHGSGWGRRWHP